MKDVSGKVLRMAFSVQDDRNSKHRRMRHFNRLGASQWGSWAYKSRTWPRICLSCTVDTETSCSMTCTACSCRLYRCMAPGNLND